MTLDNDQEGIEPKGVGGAETTPSRARRHGRKPFIPDDQQRHIVSMLAGFKMSHEEIRLLILNPDTGTAISKDTLQKAFATELAVGKSKLKMLIGTRYIERLNAGDTHSILFGMRAIWGIRDDVPGVQLNMGDDGDRKMSIRFVMPNKVLELEDDEPPQLSAPKTLDLKPNAPNSGVPLVRPRNGKADWMD